MTEKEKAIKLVEDGIANFYLGLYKLRKLEEYQEEYDSMGAALSMMQKDRQHLRTTHKVID